MNEYKAIQCVFTPHSTSPAALASNLEQFGIDRMMKTHSFPLMLCGKFTSVGPKPFAVAQRVLHTRRKTVVQIAATACQQIRGLCWYLNEGTFGLYWDYQ